MEQLPCRRELCLGRQYDSLFRDSLSLIRLSSRRAAVRHGCESWLLAARRVAVFVGALGLGLLISSAAETQQVAFQLAMLASFLPTFMLSGFIFPISSMPPFLQVVTYAVPARYFLTALRAIVLKGVGMDAFWQELVALAVFAAAVLTLSALRLRRQWT